MNPRTQTVGIVCINGNKALLVKHGESASHLTGVYGLPGGRLDEGETLLDAAAREFQEETGLIPDRDTMSELPTVYHGEIPRKSGEILSTDWYLFLVKEYFGELLSTDETEPEWVEISQVSKLNLLPNTENAIQDGLQLMHG